MAASNNSTDDTLLAEFFMDDFTRMVRQEKRALQARNNTTASQQPNSKEKVADKSDTKEKAVEKPPFDHAAFLAWAKKGPVEQEIPDVNNKTKSSPFRLRTF
jgi:hypothetical protein